MLLRDEALRLVLDRFPQASIVPSDGRPGQALHPTRVAIIDSATIERPFGWVFFYQSEEYLRTKSLGHMLVGGGPILVNKLTGEILQLGSFSWEDQLKEYERSLEIAELVRLRQEHVESEATPGRRDPFDIHSSRCFTLSAVLDPQPPDADRVLLAILQRCSKVIGDLPLTLSCWVQDRDPRRTDSHGWSAFPRRLFLGTRCRAGSLETALEFTGQPPIDSLWVHTTARDAGYAIESAPFQLAFCGRDVLNAEPIHSTLTISFHEDLLTRCAGFDARTLCNEVFGILDASGGGELGFAEVVPVKDTTHGTCYTSAASLACAPLSAHREATFRRWIASRDLQVTMLREFGWASYLNEHHAGRLGGFAQLASGMAEATDGRAESLGLLAPLASGGLVAFTSASPFDSPSTAGDPNCDESHLDLSRWLRERLEACSLWKEPT